MTQYDLDRVLDRRSWGSRKWLAYDPDVLPLWIADMDFPSPEPVLRALHERVDHGTFGYTFPPQELYEVIQQRLRALYDWRVAVEDLLLLPGVANGFNLACRIAGEPGDGVLIQPPVYHPFLAAPRNGGRVCQYAEVRRGHRRYEVQIDEFERAITARTRMLLFCNPHNPLGRVYEPDELLRLAEVCLRHDVFICSDEIHCDLVYSGHRHTPIASLAPEIARRTITLMAPSKTYNIAGLHSSFAVVQDPDLREKFQAVRAGLVSRPNLLAYIATLAAYKEGQDWLDQVLAYLEANRDCLHLYVAENLPGVDMIPPEGTHLAWLDCRGAGIPGKPAQFFLDRARVALNEGSIFGPGGEGFVRLNFACPRVVLVEALERMSSALERLPS